MISDFSTSLLKSGVLLLRPKAEDLRLWIFQHEIINDLYFIKTPKDVFSFKMRQTSNPAANEEINLKAFQVLVSI